MSNKDLELNDNHSHIDNEVSVEGVIDQVDPSTSEIVEAEKDEERKVGRPHHLPDVTTRNKVFMLSTVGTRHEDIATVLGISADTLTKYYHDELAKGRIEANASVAETLFKQAKEGNTTAMIFWLKSRAKWKETSQHEISGNPDGTPVEVKIVTGID